MYVSDTDAYLAQILTGRRAQCSSRYGYKGSLRLRPFLALSWVELDISRTHHLADCQLAD